MTEPTWLGGHRIDLAECGSTNDEAARLARAGANHGTVVVADEQTSGRGRLGRPWASPPGNLYLSAVLRLALPPGDVPAVTLAIGIAVCDVARKFGARVQNMLPFNSATLYPGTAQSFYAAAALRRVLAYFNLGTDLGNWRTWLATKGPILTRLDVDRTWDRAPETKGVLDEYKPATARGGYAVALVGYRPGGFIVRNSWGTSWGDKGFGYASLAYAQAAFTEAYGVEV